MFFHLPQTIPWHTPDAPNNIIHVRLATGSVVGQMNADAWEYPDWALFECLSPTTGDDLQLVEPAIRA